ncbi:glycosyltransferase family 2 protein [Nocardioides sp. 616]|uniref:glycosyltransferase n=1 Tax=Nocardioides sp. 616 TaxID=2268090 RepID=UPI000CE4D152|nr:glycosyltransferase family 2 protein [Nocardioides sp. 616]
MTSIAGALLFLLTLPLLLIGATRLAFVPFALTFVLRERRHQRDQAGAEPVFAEPPFVSVVVPAFQEAKVIDNCVRSVLRSDYPRLEVICVDDGSADGTYQRMQDLAAAHPQVRAVRQDNAGKGAALNTGIAQARGDVLVLVDADGVFRSDTVTRLLCGFRTPRVGAVCGNDRPVNLDHVLTRLLALISHLGTGLMRRALHVLGCLPVVSGNIGAFRREVLDRTGPLRTDTLGEDLELTWRLHLAGYQVAFAPDALVYAESPSTLSGLWRQRVRWARGLLQATALHWGAVGRLRYGTFGLYLLFNTASQVVAPFIQIAAILSLAGLVATEGPAALPGTLMGWILLLGLPLSLGLLLFANWLDGSLRDLRYLWTVVLWPFYSTLMTLVMLEAVRLELANAENRWNKLERTGTVSVRGLLDEDDRGSSSS